MKQSKIILIIFLILTFYLSFSYFLNMHRALHPDEAFRLLLSQESPDKYFIDTHPPTYLWIMKLIPNINLLRYLNSLIGIFLIIPITYIAKKIRANPAIIAILFYTNYQILNYTTSATNTLPATTLLIIATYYYLEKKINMYCIFSYLAIAMNPLTALNLVATYIYELYKNKKHNHKILITGILSTLFFIPILTNTNYTSWLQTPTLPTILVSLILITGSLPGLIILIPSMYKQKYLATQILIPIIILLSISLTIKPFWHDRYLVYTIPAATLTIAATITKLPKKIPILLTTILVIAQLLILPILYDQDWQEIRQANQAISGGRVLHHSTFSLYPSMAYTPNATHLLDNRNYTLPTPLLQPQNYINPLNKSFDYELIATGNPSILNGTLTEYDGLTLILSLNKS